MLNTSAFCRRAALSGCPAHCGGLRNNAKGALLGGVAGGFVVNQFGGGSVNAAATALGAVFGVIAGQSLSHDAPVQQPYMSSGSCNQYTNQGARAACNRGVAARENQRQNRLEREAYRAGLGR